MNQIRAIREDSWTPHQGLSPCHFAVASSCRGKTGIHGQKTMDSRQRPARVGVARRRVECHPPCSTSNYERRSGFQTASTRRRHPLPLEAERIPLLLCRARPSPHPNIQTSKRPNVQTTKRPNVQTSKPPNSQTSKHPTSRLVEAVVRADAAEFAGGLDALQARLVGTHEMLRVRRVGVGDRPHQVEEIAVARCHRVLDRQQLRSMIIREISGHASFATAS